jgi:hypothetical protein
MAFASTKAVEADPLVPTVPGVAVLEAASF